SAYLAELGMPDLAIVGVAGWHEAAAVTQHPDWSRAWWDAETRAQGELQRLALARARAGIADPMLTRVASGAAAQACHQAALAIAAAAGPDHLFAIKFRLFAAGRWPLGIVGDRFFVL